MVEQTQVETAKLSLVGKHNHAVAFADPQQENELHQVEDVLVRLPTVLQTTIELDDVIKLFHNEISKVLSYDSLHYTHQGVMCDINTGSRSHHSCNYRLEMNSVWLGELTLTHNKKFTDEDTQLLEDLLCKLIYPYVIVCYIAKHKPLHYKINLPV